ncbi:MAG: murein biosynthesis integral membrane protein MurJ [Oligoflexus sp.]
MSVAKSSFLFAAGTLLSRISGLIRDMVVVGVFGASALLDAFLVAFRIPNLLREMLAEGALGSSFTKVYSELMEKDRARAQQVLVDCIWLFTLVSIIVCFLGIIFAPQLVGLMTLQVETAERPEFLHNTIGLTRLLFPYLGLMIISSVVMGALHQGGRFFLSAFAPVGFNLGFILGAWLLADLMAKWDSPWVREYLGEPRIVGLAIGVLLGGLAQLIMQGSSLAKLIFQKLPQAFGRRIWNEETRKVVKLMLPASIAASAGPINVFINTNFATSLGDGAVSWLNFAFRLLQLPIGLFGVAVGVAVLPALSRSLARTQGKVTGEASRYLQNATDLVAWLMMLCFAFILMNHQAIIALLFQHGKFTSADTLATSQALYAYSFGVLGYGLIKVFTSFYYAVERTDFAMKVSLFSIFVNFTGNYLLVERFGHIGLAWTSAITLSMNAIILALGMRSFHVKLEWKGLLRSLLCLGLAVVLSILFMGLASNVMAQWDLNLPLKIEAGLQLLINGLLLVLVFAGFAALNLKLTPQALLIRVKSGLRRKK